MQLARLTAFEIAAAALLRLDPLKSGCISVANCGLARWLVRPRHELVTANIRGRRCIVPLDDLVGRSIFLAGDLDPKITWVIDRYVRGGDTVLDVGANLGLVSLLLASRAQANGRILMFEPARDMLALLHETLALNDDSGMRLFPFALGRKEETLTLTVPEGNAGAASLIAENVRWQKESYSVPVRRLSDVFSEEKVGSVDFMKIDVEGFEPEVFGGLFDDPAAPRPKLIVFENNGLAASPAEAILKDNGYRIFGLPRRLVFPQLVPESHADYARSHDLVAIHEHADPGRLRGLGL